MKLKFRYIISYSLFLPQIQDKNKKKNKKKRKKTTRYIINQFYRNPIPDVHLYLMSKSDVMVARKNFLKRHEEETLSGTRLKREPNLI